MAWLDSYKTKDGTKRYRLIDRDDNGSKVTVIKDAGVFKETAKEIKKRYEDNKARQANGLTLPDKKIVVAVEDWIKARKREPATSRNYRVSVLHYLKHSPGITTIGQMNATNIEAWRSGMQEGSILWSRKGEPNRVYNENGIKILISTMRTFCNFMISRGWVSDEIFKGIIIPTIKTQKKILSKEDLIAFIRACRADTFRTRGGGHKLDTDRTSAIIQKSLANPTYGKLALSKLLIADGVRVSCNGVAGVWRRHGMTLASARLAFAEAGLIPTPIKKAPAKCRNRDASSALRKVVLFGLYTGMRVGEVLRAKWEHIIVVPPSKTSDEQWILYIGKSKTHLDRSVPLHPKLWNILGRRNLGTTGFLFPEWNKDKLGHARGRAMRLAGVGRVRYHDLRHNFVRFFLKSRAGGLAEAKGITGHANLQGLQHYAHFDSGDLAEAMAKMKLTK